MKVIITILVLMTIAYTTVIAQSEFEFKVLEENRAMTKGSANALIVHLPNTTYKKVNKLWSKYLRNFRGKMKYNRKRKEYFVDNAELKEMSDNAVDITSKIQDNGTEGTTVVVWFNLGVTYLSSDQYPERYLVGAKLLKEFSLLASADMIAEQLKEEEKLLATMKDTYEDLEKDKASEENNITKQKQTIIKAEASIATSERKIEENLEAQEKQKLSIKEQEKIVEQVKRKLKMVQK